MSKHTPGPWRTFNGTDVFPDDGDREGERQIADCAMSHAMPIDEEQANARLIAAAPELLEALQRLTAEAKLDGMDKRAGWDCWVSMADKAIAKATGAQPTRSQAMDELTTASAEEMFPAGILPGAEGSRQ